MKSNPDLTDRVLIIGTDGLRPDLAGGENMPVYERMRRQGTTYTSFSAVYPSQTRVSMSTLTTGVYPGRHGIVQNLMYVPGFAEDGLLQTGNDRHLLRFAKDAGEPLLLAPTLGDRLARHGKHLAVAASSSPGASLLWNINRPEKVINPASVYGTPALEARHKRLGAVPDEAQMPKISRAKWAVRALIEEWLDDETNQVLVLWLSEPDSAYHSCGLGSPEAQQAAAAVDQSVGLIFEELEQRGLMEQFHVLWISDHGHSTVGNSVSLQERVEHARRILSLQSEYLVAEQAIYSHSAGDGATRDAVKLAEWLLQQPWCGTLLSSSQDVLRIPGVRPLEAVAGRAEHTRFPLLSVSPAWSPDANSFGVPGTTWSLSDHAAVKSQHGSLAPYDQSACLIGLGAKFKPGHVSDIPLSLVDIAPTVCRLIGLNHETGFDGRSIIED